MLAIERKNEILDKLRAEQRVLVSDLAAYYHVTEETIRRDLDKLEKEGYATKTYGGAILGNSTKTDLSYTIRNKTNVEAKNQIAAIASRLIEDGDHLMLDDSSTSLYLAKKLKEKKNLTVITNSVELVVELSDVEGWTILLTGGRLKPESLALVGDQTQQALRRYHVDKAVMSCKGIDLESGVTDSSEFHSQTKQSMLRCAKTRILILDSSKFDKISFIVNKNDKIAFVGENELAQTTLFKILMGELEPDEGSVKWGQTVTTSYLPKDNTEYFEGCSDSLVDWIRQFSSKKDDVYLRGFLGRMLFSGEEVFKPVNVLSGGEKVRCMLSRMMLSGANVLLLDQPTNHLDMEAIQAVNKGLCAFPGNILLASHDHELLQTTCNRVIEFQPDGTIIDRLSSYDDYIAWKLAKEGN